MIKDIWITGKLVFSLYKEILFDGGPIISIRLNKSILVSLVLVSLYLMFWSN